MAPDCELCGPAGLRRLETGVSASEFAQLPAPGSPTPRSIGAMKFNNRKQAAPVDQREDTSRSLLAAGALSGGVVANGPPKSAIRARHLILQSGFGSIFRRTKFTAPKQLPESIFARAGDSRVKLACGTCLAPSLSWAVESKEFRELARGSQRGTQNLMGQIQLSPSNAVQVT